MQGRHLHQTYPLSGCGPLKLPDPPSLADAIEPLLSVLDLCRILRCNRRTIERLRAGGKLPRPDANVGRMPRWKAETIRRWIENGGTDANRRG
jgi:hypothetical protein